MKIMKLMQSMLLGMLLLLFTVGSAMALPSEWGVISPADVVASDADMLNVMTNYWQTATTGPAYFIWTNDSARFSWNIAWTGGYGHSTDYFSGLIALENAQTNDFQEVSFDSNDQILFQSNAAVSFSAHAWNYFDGIEFTIMDYTAPAYVGFDLGVNGFAADPSHIFLGTSMQTVESLGEDQDFAMAAPVPEPASMLLLGSGLFGLATFKRRRMK